MSRSLIESNQSIFAILDDHCAKRGLILKNVGQGRWIGSRPVHRHFMINAHFGEYVHFSPARKLAEFHLDGKSYLCSVGFERSQTWLRDAELEVDPAFLTVALAELKPRPSASIAEVREIVEWSDKNSDERYNGHDFEGIASLFPQVLWYKIEDDNKQFIWNIFFRACVEECDFGGMWIEGDLASTLRSLCELDSNRIPYRVLCRSIFDGDRSSFFLALYRCLEALYAYSSSQSLAAALAISNSWAEISVALEDKLGWHPREETSLANIMKFAGSIDLKSIIRILGGEVTSNPELLAQRAAKAIYKLRNSIVHYRPAQHQINMDEFDWTAICKAMVGVILDVYEAVFTGTSAPSK